MRRFVLFVILLAISALFLLVQALEIAYHRASVEAVNERRLEPLARGILESPLVEAVALSVSDHEKMALEARRRLRGNDLQGALKLFEELLRNTKDPKLQAAYYHDAGLAHLLLEEAEIAAEKFKSCLRREPDNMPCKLNLERLYSSVIMQKGKEAGLKQIPGKGESDEATEKGSGAGRSSPKGGI